MAREKQTISKDDIGKLPLNIIADEAPKTRAKMLSDRQEEIQKKQMVNWDRRPI